MRERTRIAKLEERISHLSVQLETAQVDRDYYRAHRDRWKQTATERGQAIRQIIVAVESESPDAMDAILRIARTNSGA